MSITETTDIRQWNYLLTSTLLARCSLFEMDLRSRINPSIRQDKLVLIFEVSDNAGEERYFAYSRIAGQALRRAIVTSRNLLNHSI